MSMHSISGSSIDGKVRTRVDENVETRALRRADGGVFERALGNARGAASCPLTSTSRVEAGTRARVADVALALALDFDEHGVVVAVDEHWTHLEAVTGVSPLVQSVLRVRLKNVT